MGKKNRLTRPDILSIIAIIISFFAIIPSFRSCSIAEESLNLSNKALDISKKSNDIAQKSLEFSEMPYIAVKPVQFKDPKSYFKIDETKDQTVVSVKLQLTNSGKSLATDIIIPSKARSRNDSNQKPIAYCEPNQKIPILSLPPSESYFMDLQVAYKKEGSGNLIENLSSGKESLTVESSIKYKGVATGLTYATLFSFKIYNNTAIILDQKFLTEDQIKSITSSTTKDVLPQSTPGSRL